jgi:hypothetical protein
VLESFFKQVFSSHFADRGIVTDNIRHAGYFFLFARDYNRDTFFEETVGFLRLMQPDNRAIYFPAAETR